jgi:hypothetical protein
MTVKIFCVDIFLKIKRFEEELSYVCMTVVLFLYAPNKMGEVVTLLTCNLEAIPWLRRIIAGFHLRGIFTMKGQFMQALW